MTFYPRLYVTQSDLLKFVLKSFLITRRENMVLLSKGTF